MKAAMITKPTGDVWIKPETDRKGREYYVVTDSAGQWWGFSSSLEEARLIRLNVLAR